jgi:hypothetical protein
MVADYLIVALAFETPLEEIRLCAEEERKSGDERDLPCCSNVVI